MDASNDRCTTELIYIPEVVIPKEIKESCERMTFLNTKTRKFGESLIVDNNLFLNLIKEMQYFYVRGLVERDRIGYAQGRAAQIFG